MAYCPEYYKANKEKILAQRRIYYEKNKARILEWHSNYWDEYKDLINAERMRKYHAKKKVLQSD